MKKTLILSLVILFNLTSKAQTIHSSAPDSVYTFDMFIPWWGNFVPALDSIDNQYISTEVCSSNGSDTLFFGSFKFKSVNLENSLVYLKITKIKSGYERRIRDAYLAVIYNGKIISDNLADTTSIWSDNDSTSTYIIDNSSLQLTLDTNILNDSSFGFIFSTSPSDPVCMSASINSVRLYVEESGINNNVTRTINKNETIKIFPNPTNGQLNIDLNSLENHNVKILNVRGELMIEYSNISKSPLKIDLKDQVPGMYLVIISNKESTSSYKFLIE